MSEVKQEEGNVPRVKRTRKRMEMQEMIGEFDTVGYSKVFGKRMENLKKFPIKVELAAANNVGMTTAEGLSGFKEEEKKL